MTDTGPEDPPAPRRRGRGRGSVGREAIIASTRELLRQVPVSSLNRKLVAEAAEVDPSLVRYYFDDLRTLLTEVLKVMAEDYRQKYAELGIDPKDPRDAIARRLHHLVTFLARDISFHELFVEQIINGQDNWARETRDAFTDTFYGALEVLIEEGRAQGLFRDDFDARFIYLAMIGGAQFLGSSRTIFHRLFGDEAKPSDLSESYADLLTTLVLKGIER